MSRRIVSTFSVIFCLLVGGLAWGQSTTGNLYGTVMDESGAALPGVKVTVTGIGPMREQFTDEQGAFRFLALDPGGYSVLAELEGFGGLEFPDVAIRLGRNTDLPLTLTAALEETITVTSESPLLDERAITAGTNVTQVELEKIPTARDPWSILTQTPGVLVDRVNVGGSESGQQAAFRAAGVSSDENDFQMDGAEITDMRAIGASPTYYDFDQFAEMSFTTGGTDVTKNSAGVQVNLVTKRGTNEFRGSTRFYNTQATGYFGGALKAAEPNIESELYTANGQTFLPGARVRKIEDFGFEAGGAAIQDRLWFWGSWGQNDIGQNAASGTADDTLLENTVIKANGQITNSNAIVGSFNNGDKLKFGRGAAVNRPPETTFNQRGPSAQYRLEDQHVASANLFFTGTYSHGDFGFQLLARGTLASENGLDPDSLDPRLVDGVWQDNFYSGGAASPNDLYKLDGSYFFTTGANVNHELRFGGRFRTYENASVFEWGPRGTWHDLEDGLTGYDFLVDTGELLAEYTGLWVQDTISFGRITVNAGLRYDEQGGENSPYVLPAHPVRPDLIPSVDYPGGDAGFTWESITPRLGLTYALGDERKTLLRGSVSQFADQLATNSVTRLSPLGRRFAYVDSITNELEFTNVNADDPFTVFNTVDSGLKPPTTTEVLLGVEHAFLPELVASFGVTMRSIDDITEAYSYVTANGERRLGQPSDWMLIGTTTGTLPRGGGSYSAPVYDRIPSVRNAAGSHLTNGPRSRDYLGYSVSVTKRLSNRWMARGFFQLGDAEWNVPSSYQRHTDPTGGSGGGDIDGQLYMEESGGSGKAGVFIQSSWSYNLNGMYQVAPDRPWGFNVSANFTGREGGPVPYYTTIRRTQGSVSVNLVDDFDSVRLNDINVIDFRIDKEFALSSPINFTFGIDIFNLTNEGTGLRHLHRVGPTNAGNLADNIAARVYRLGVRLSWR